MMSTGGDQRDGGEEYPDAPSIQEMMDMNYEELKKKKGKEKKNINDNKDFQSMLGEKLGEFDMSFKRVNVEHISEVIKG